MTKVKVTGCSNLFAFLKILLLGVTTFVLNINHVVASTSSADDVTTTLAEEEETTTTTTTTDILINNFVTIHKDDISKECKLCNDETDCGGLTFTKNLDEPNNYVDRTRHFFLSPSIVDTRTIDDNKNVHDNNNNNSTSNDNETSLLKPFVSNKKWLVHRGLIMDANYEHEEFDGSHFLLRMENVTIIEARTYCQTNNECIGFSIPLQRNEEKNGMTNLVTEVMFVSYISLIDYTIDEEYGEEEWITHIYHNRTRLENKIDLNFVNIEEGKYEETSTSPYRPCCHKPKDLPTIEEIQQIDTLERISCNITRDEFYKKYEQPRIPVMLVDCDKYWPARTLWKDTSTLLNRFDNETEWNQISGVGNNVKWEQFYNYYHNKKQRQNKGYRIFEQLDHESVARELYKDYIVPKPFEDADLYSYIPNYDLDYFPNGFGPMHWFLLGSRGTGTMPHMDPHRTDAWNTVLSGHKWWVVYPNRPKVIERMEVKCFPECSTFFPSPNKANDDEVVSWYSSVGRHAHKMYYDTDRAMQILQGPGETLYVPYGMIHSVLNLDETIAITQNYGAPGNIEQIWGEILLEGYEMDWKELYYNVLTKEQRQRVRNIMWPIDLTNLPNTIEVCEGAYDEEDDADYDDNDDEEEEEEVYYDDEDEEEYDDENYHLIPSDENDNVNMASSSTSSSTLTSTQSAVHSGSSSSSSTTTVL